MGVIICEYHGKQSISFTSPNIISDINNDSQIELTIHQITIEFLGTISKHYIDDEYLEKFNLKANDTVVVEEENTREAEIFFNLKAVCSVCLKNYVRNKMNQAEN